MKSLLISAMILISMSSMAGPVDRKIEDQIRKIERIMHKSPAPRLVHKRKASDLLDKVIAQLRGNGGGGGGGPVVKVLATFPDTHSTFGCAVGYQGLKIEKQGNRLALVASNLKADYRWSGKSALSVQAIPYKPKGKADLLYINFANRRDNIELKVTRGGDLVGRCKSYQNFMTVKLNVIPKHLL